MFCHVCHAKIADVGCFRAAPAIVSPSKTSGTATLEKHNKFNYTMTLREKKQLISIELTLF